LRPNSNNFAPEKLLLKHDEKCHPTDGFCFFYYFGNCLSTAQTEMKLPCQTVRIIFDIPIVKLNEIHDFMPSARSTLAPSVFYIIYVLCHNWHSGESQPSCFESFIPLEVRIFHFESVLLPKFAFLSVPSSCLWIHASSCIMDEYGPLQI
jgi:hypothetical protein